MIFNAIFVGSLFILNIRIVAGDEDYCKLKCDDNPNVACDCEKSPTCKDTFSEAPLVDEERDFIVKLHNQLRRRVANANDTKTFNGAANMMAVQYDKALEHVAMCAAKKCVKEKATCSRTKTFKKVGQNVYHSLRDCVGGRDIMEAFNDWFMQVRLGTMECFSKAFSCKGMDEFTQLIYADVERIGCARIQSGTQACTVICNYGPLVADGVPVMKFGKPGSECPDTAPNRDGLCTTLQGGEMRSLAWRPLNGHRLLWSFIIIVCTIRMFVT